MVAADAEAVLFESLSLFLTCAARVLRGNKSSSSSPLPLLLLLLSVRSTAALLRLTSRDNNLLPVFFCRGARDLLLGRAMLQVTYQDYLDRGAGSGQREAMDSGPRPPLTAPRSP